MEDVMSLDYLKPFMTQSVVKQTVRGTRRYFPITAKRKRGWKWLYQTFFIIYGREPKERAEVGFAILSQSLDKYVERFDGKLWVRTVAV
jgi:hypothetical protein